MSFGGQLTYLPSRPNIEAIANSLKLLDSNYSVTSLFIKAYSIIMPEVTKRSLGLPEFSTEDIATAHKERNKLLLRSLYGMFKIDEKLYKKEEIENLVKVLIDQEKLISIGLSAFGESVNKRPVPPSLQSYPMAHEEPFIREEFLKPDWAYVAYHLERNRLLNGPSKNKTIQFAGVPRNYVRADQKKYQELGNRARTVQRDVLHLLCHQMSKYTPKQFRFDDKREIFYINIGNLLNKTIKFEDERKKGRSDLEIASSIAQEDLNILVPYPATSEEKQKTGCENMRYLGASAHCFPAGLDLEKRIGHQLVELHQPVLVWKEKLWKAVESRLDKVTAGGRDKALDKAFGEGAFVRMAVFPQFNHPEPRKNLGDILLVPDGSVFYKNHTTGNLKKEDIFIRREHQTFYPLPNGCILFAVRTHVLRVVDLPDQQLIAFLQECAAVPHGHMLYKESDKWVPRIQTIARSRGLAIPKP